MAKREYVLLIDGQEKMGCDDPSEAAVVPPSR